MWCMRVCVTVNLYLVVTCVWLLHCPQGEVTLLNEYSVRMYYSTPKTREAQDNRQQADWTCSKVRANICTHASHA